MQYTGSGKHNEYPDVSNNLTMSDVYTFNPAAQVAQDPFYRGMAFLKTALPTLVSSVQVAARYRAQSLIVENLELQSEKNKDSEKNNLKKILSNQEASKRWSIMGGDVKSALEMKRQILSTQDEINNVTSNKNVEEETLFQELSGFDKDLATAVVAELPQDSTQTSLSESVDYGLTGWGDETTLYPSHDRDKIGAFVKSLQSNEKIEKQLTAATLQSARDNIAERYELTNYQTRALELAGKQIEASSLSSETKELLSKKHYGNKEKKNELLSKYDKLLDSDVFDLRSDQRKQLINERYQIKQSLFLNSNS